MNYGKAFRDIRTGSQMTQKDAAKRLGISTAALWKIENGHSMPKPATISKFCSLMGVPFAYLCISALEPADFCTK